MRIGSKTESENCKEELVWHLEDRQSFWGAFSKAFGLLFPKLLGAFSKAFLLAAFIAWAFSKATQHGSVVHVFKEGFHCFIKAFPNH